MIDTVLVRARAFTQILGYAIEVYKHECMGVLLGTRLLQLEK